MSERERILKLLKKGVWIYFYLLIFEGALRKWVLPGLAAPLLIIRDPLAIWLIVMSLKHGFWKVNKYTAIMWILTVFSFIMTFLAGHGNLFVALYGMRITLLHFPVIFIVGAIFNKEDVEKMGKVMLWITVGMTVLVALQFFSPQSAWVNRGIGGDMAGSGFTGTSEYFRVPGVFSFANGLSLFYGLSAAFIFYFWMNTEKVPRYLLISATVALICAIPLSISRTLFFEIVLSLAFFVMVSKQSVKTIVVAAILVPIMLIILSQFSFFETATGAFTERFTSANKNEGGLVEGVLIDRFLGGMYAAVTTEDATFFGMGMGMGTNAGAMLAGMGGHFVISEGEWGRLVGEMGFLFGLFMILIRFSVTASLFKVSLKNIRIREKLPWMLTSFAFLNVLQAQWAQPTALGFSVFGAGLVLAASNLTTPKLKVD